MRTFAKADPAPLEAAGLRWLAEAGARVPDIVSDAPDRLVLRRIEAGRLDPAGEADLGRMLATVHTAGAPRYGALPAAGRFLVGRFELPSVPDDDPERFWRAQRLGPPAARVGLAREVAAVRWEVPDERPARLHGDLWWGNVLADPEGRPWLIDPACYGGHREVDLAMLALFGPLPVRTVAAYEEVSPLADGWRDRIGFWQLFPLLVHAALFGEPYRRRAADLAHALAR